MGENVDLGHKKCEKTSFHKRRKPTLGRVGSYVVCLE